MSITLDGSVIAAIDAQLDKINAHNAETGDPAWTRSDAVRKAMKEWLASNPAERVTKPADHVYRIKVKPHHKE